MTVDVYPLKPPNAVAFVLAWLLPAAASPLNLGSKRWSTGAPLPYWMVHRVTGADDLISDFPVVRVHTIAATETECQREMDRVNARMRVLVDDPLTDVLMPDGSIANCDWCEIPEGPRPDPPPYSSVLATDPAAAVVSRLVTEYQLGLPYA